DLALPRRFGTHADKVWMLQAPWFLLPSRPSAGSLPADAACALRHAIDAAVTRSLQHSARDMEHADMPARHADSTVDEITQLCPRRAPCSGHTPDDATQTVLAAARLGSGRRRRRLS